MRKTLTTEEREMIRNACENAPRSRESHVYPLFPIVLLDGELSTNQTDLANTERWKAGTPSEMAINSCKRNLGLVDFRWAPSTDSKSWTCQWT